jgi:hypothetical protein
MQGNLVTSPTALAKNMVSTVKSGFFRVASGTVLQRCEGIVFKTISSSDNRIVGDF